MIVFFVVASVFGIGYSWISTFLFLFLKMPDMNAPDLLLGLTIFFTVLVEIPLFQHSQLLFETFSERKVFAASGVAWIIRVVGYSFLSGSLPGLGVWWVLVLEPLHGITFGCMWLSSVRLISRVFPAELTNSGFALLNAFVFGIGPLVGNITGGWLFDLLGPRAMFRWGALGMTGIMVVYIWLDTRMALSDKVGWQGVVVGAAAGGGGGAESSTPDSNTPQDAPISSHGGGTSAVAAAS